MRIDFWFDFACAHCYYASHNLGVATASLASAEIHWHSFELDPRPREARPEGDLYDYLAPVNGSRAAARAAMDRIAVRALEAGLPFHPDRVVPRKTEDAHRVVQLAASHGKTMETVHRLQRAYWSEGLDFADIDAMAALAGQVGLPSRQVRVLLESDDLRDEVRADRADAVALGVPGVPSILIDQRRVVAATLAVEQLRLAIAR